MKKIFASPNVLMYNDSEDMFMCVKMRGSVFMARTARVKSSTGKYIVMLKGIDETLFKTKKAKELFTNEAESRFGGEIQGIRFFSDRAVMIVTESEKGISIDMKPVLISFARALNNEKKTDGKVFADRFKSMPIETEEFSALCEDYINGKTAKDPFGAVRKTATEKKVQQKKESAPKKKAEPKKKAAPKAEAKPKVTEEPKKEVEAPKPKRRNDMPTWLL